MRFCYSTKLLPVYVQHEDGRWALLRECLDGYYEEVLVTLFDGRDERWHPSWVIASCGRAK